MKKTARPNLLASGVLGGIAGVGAGNFVSDPENKKKEMKAGAILGAVAGIGLSSIAGIKGGAKKGIKKMIKKSELAAGRMLLKEAVGDLSRYVGATRYLPEGLVPPRAIRRRAQGTGAMFKTEGLGPNIRSKTVLDTFRVSKRGPSTVLDNKQDLITDLVRAEKSVKSLGKSPKMSEHNRSIIKYRDNLKELAIKRNLI